jgi:hypothetical protein
VQDEPRIDDLLRIELVGRCAEPDLEVEVFEPFVIERVGADETERLACDDALLRSSELGRRDEQVVGLPTLAGGRTGPCRP